MTKLWIAVLIVLGGTLNMTAQQKGDFEVGANIGVNTTTIFRGSDDAELNHTMNAGISGEYYFSDRWGVKAKLIYDRKGWDKGYIVFDEDSFTAYETDYNLDYLTIPVTASWHFGKKRNWYLHFGPYVGILMNAKDSRFDQDVKKHFNTTDWGIDVGVGVKFPVSDKLKLFVEYEYQSGLSDIAKNNDGKRFVNFRGALNVGVNFIVK